MFVGLLFTLPGLTSHMLGRQRRGKKSERALLIPGGWFWFTCTFVAKEPGNQATESGYCCLSRSGVVMEQAKAE